MAKNGVDDPWTVIQKELAELERLREAELERAIDRRVALEVKLRLAERERPMLQRSKMSTAEKSRYIQAHGKEAYLALPWQLDGGGDRWRTSTHPTRR
jgi:hypothetical protein